VASKAEWLKKVTTAIADGDTVDWDRVSCDATLSADELRVLRSLAAIRHPRGVVTKGLAPIPLEQGFDVLEELGHGSNGRVYRAIDRALGREVALKVLDEDSGFSVTARERFVREARILASLDHPNIVRIHSIDESDGRLRLSLEKIEGRTLTQALGESGPFAAAEAARIGIDLCHALAAIHGSGLVHRDLKPSNVMQASGGRIVLLDFGVARSMSDLSEDPRVRVEGTPLFLSPEQLEGLGETGPGTDLYALGVLLYWMVSAHYPYEAQSLVELREQVRSGRAQQLTDLRGDVPPRYAAIVNRLLASQPPDRFQSAGEAEEALRAFLEEASLLRAQEPKRSRRTFLLGGAGATLALLLGIAGVPRFFGSSEFELEAQMVARRDGAEVALHGGDAVHPGDGLVLSVKANRDLYLYVFNEDGNGQLTALFPLSGYDLENPVPSGATHRLPGSWKGTPYRWGVSNGGGGTERFLLIASPDPVSGAEALLRDAPEARRIEGPVPVTPQGRARLLRSVGFAEPDPEGGSTPHDGSSTSSRLETLIGVLEQGPIRSRKTICRLLRFDNRPE
jgi:hypothetical protein